ncbi:MAG: hypothetical protein NTV92_05325 [Candidatus Bipolaricaulota bacterium]|nr:hypothetical protein [Candidatus Bipolaricaulota bacterium]
MRGTESGGSSGTGCTTAVNRGERDPRQRRQEQEVVAVRFRPQSLRAPSALDAFSRVGGESEERWVVAERREAEGVAVREHGDRRMNDRVFDHDVAPEALTQRRYVVGRRRERVRKADREREAAPSMGSMENRYVDVGRHAEVREAESAKELKRLSAAPRCGVNDAQGVDRVYRLVHHLAAFTSRSSLSLAAGF